MAAIIPATEGVKAGKQTVWSNFENGTGAKSSAVCSCAIKTCRAIEGQPGVRQIAICVIKGSQSCKIPIGGDPEDRAEAVRASLEGRAIEIPVRALHRRGQGISAIRAAGK